MNTTQGVRPDRAPCIVCLLPAGQGFPSGEICAIMVKNFHFPATFPDPVSFNRQKAFERILRS